MKRLAVAALVAGGVLAGVASTANAATLSSDLYEVTSIDGNWTKASTGWSLGSPASLAESDAVLSDGYFDVFDQTTFNGIVSHNGTLVFGTGGTDYVLNSFSFITTRNYNNDSIVYLDYQLNGGGWINAATISAADLIAPLSSCLSISGNLCAGKIAVMSFGGVLADEWRWRKPTGDQVSLHEVAIDADLSPVPLPAALPLFGGALSLLGFLGWRRRRAERQSSKQQSMIRVDVLSQSCCQTDFRCAGNIASLISSTSRVRFSMRQMQPIAMFSTSRWRTAISW